MSNKSTIKINIILFIISILLTKGQDTNLIQKFTFIHSNLKYPIVYSKDNYYFIIASETSINLNKETGEKQVQFMDNYSPPFLFITDASNNYFFYQIKVIIL